MKKVVKIAPHPFLQPYIESYSWREINTPDVTTFPSFKEHLINIFIEGKYALIDVNNQTIEKPNRAIIIGQQTKHNWNLQFNGSHKMLAIQFRPFGMNSLFGTNMTSFLNKFEIGQDVLGQSFNELEERLRESLSIELQTDLLNSYFTKLLDSRKISNKYLFESINYLQANVSNFVKIEDVASSANVSLRQFERKFKEITGTSPRTFLKKERFLKLLENARTSNKINWMDLTYKAGYYDQAHLIKDFKLFTSLKPSEYIRSTSSFSIITY